MATGDRDARWEQVPLRIPGGWAVRHNGLDVRRAPDGTILEINDSEDLLWLQRLPPPGQQAHPAEGPWRDRSVDLGWYRDHFRLVVLDPDWDHVVASHRTPSLDEVVSVLEAWLRALPG